MAESSDENDERQPLLGKARNGSSSHSPDGSPVKSIALSKARQSIDNDSKIVMKRTVGFLEGTAIVLGIIVGSGIFVSPAGVAVNSGSVGMSLIIWTLCGAFSALGALSFAELGTTIPRSGGDYLYILEVFGPFMAFMRLWIELTVIRPASHAIIALTLATYVVQVSCIEAPPLALQLISLLSIAFISWVNCKSSKWSTSVQNIFTAAKVAALLLIIILGIVQMAKGNWNNLTPERVFDGSSSDFGKIILAINAGLWAFCGWNELNYITDEIKNPSRNLPLAIVTSIFLITVLYVSVNLAYFTVLLPADMAANEATAVIFGKITMGKWSIIIPVCVALCCFGGINGSVFTSSRLFYIGACEGHLPSIMGMISVKSLTPVPSVIVIGVLSAVYMCTDNVFLLITYVNFVYYLAMGIAIVGLIILRFKCPNLERPLKLPLIVPIFAALLCLATGVLSFVEAPIESGIGMGMVLTSVPIYIVFVKWEKPRKLEEFYVWFTEIMQLITESVVEEIRLPDQ
uniref:Large neutral amino acids transporter small subunit 1-like n=1 Tax=Phallusia mammillata TaxID=59560 RepID=A0A6F9DT21_9ASCI|nr:large neutral amino acids transporter small subunit 1-like [Phallusia mammillata]